MENTTKNDPYNGLIDVLSKNRSSLSVKEVEQLKKLLSTIEKDTSNSTKEAKDEKKKIASNAIKQLLGFMVKHEIYSYIKEFLG